MHGGDDRDSNKRRQALAADELGPGRNRVHWAHASIRRSLALLSLQFMA